jgi:hypothetical protein
MRISAYHKAKGDTVEWFEGNTLLRLASEFDAVYSSKVFDFTPENEELPDNAIKGGTGYGIYNDLPPEIDRCFPDYSIYPECDYAIGYLTRGCPNKCRWCVVPIKEGSIRPYADYRDVVRPDSKKLTLMDNNILAIDHGIRQLELLSATPYRLDLNQGMDARLVDGAIARILSAVKWQRYIRFSCDQSSQLPAIERAVSLLQAAGIKPGKVLVYLLVTADIADAAHRVEELKRIGVGVLFAQAEMNPRLGITPNAAQKEFANRYIYGKKYLSETWEDYCGRYGFSAYAGDLGNLARYAKNSKS